MVIDASAVFAILRREPDAQCFAVAIEESTVRLMSAVTVLECGIVARARKGDAGARDFDDFLAATSPKIVPFDADQAAIARDAFVRFGKGQHDAALNFGDCAVYALAASRVEPLLCKGGDFAATDLVLVRVA
ncbi:MAG: type II toxin-antitoxin system VapC family toxin [Alphaproteobacteria bacterium]|nr:type II toxin-antitoxin system VapC family toxin [Alphaproteobacteria bacterium]